MKSPKDPNVKGRKYNGHPHLKLKRVRESPRQRIRQLLRSFVPLERPGESREPEQQAGPDGG